jgi:hypothetical protein
MKTPAFVLAIGFVSATLLATYSSAERTRCDRTLGWTKLSEDEQKKLLTEAKSGPDRFPEVIAKSFATDSEFRMAVVYKVIPRDPESVMAIFTRYDEAPQYLGPHVESAVIEDPIDSKTGKPYVARRTRVKYTFNPGKIIPRNTYTVVDSISKPRPERHFVSWDLYTSTGSLGRPIYVDGYYKAEPAGSNGNFTVVTYCNYVVPEVPSSIPFRSSIVDTINTDGFEMVQTTVRKTAGWIVGRSDAAVSKAVSEYRAIEF